MSYYEKSKFKLSNHAIRRYIERFDRNLNISQAEIKILDILEDAQLFKVEEDFDIYLSCDCKYKIITSKNKLVKTIIEYKK